MFEDGYSMDKHELCQEKVGPQKMKELPIHRKVHGGKNSFDSLGLAVHDVHFSSEAAEWLAMRQAPADLFGSEINHTSWSL